jgi:hypothetical protein
MISTRMATTAAAVRCRYSTKAPGAAGGTIRPKDNGQSGMALAASMKHTAPPRTISTPLTAAAASVREA